MERQLLNRLFNEFLKGDMMLLKYDNRNDVWVGIVYSEYNDQRDRYVCRTYEWTRNPFFDRATLLETHDWFYDTKGIRTFFKYSLYIKQGNIVYSNQYDKIERKVG